MTTSDIAKAAARQIVTDITDTQMDFAFLAITQPNPQQAGLDAVDAIAAIISTALDKVLDLAIERTRELLTAQFRGFTNADELVEKNIAELRLLRTEGKG